MRFCHRVFLSLCIALVTVPALGTSIVSTNTGTCPVVFGFDNNMDGFPQTSVSVPGHEARTIGPDYAGGSGQWGLSYDGGSSWTMMGGVSWTSGTHNFSADGCPPVLTTNHWCVYTINWRNPSAGHYAEARAYAWNVGGSGQMGALLGIAAISPGNTWSQTFTNNMGTNAASCGSAMVYDGRLGDNAPLTYYEGTHYESTSGGVSSGSGNNTGTQGPITGYTNGPSSTSGGGTNVVSQHDIYTLGDLFSQALADLERALNNSIQMQNSNQLALNQLLSGLNTNWAALMAGMATNMSASSSNLAALISGLNTNQLAGLMGSLLTNQASGLSTNGPLWEALQQLGRGIGELNTNLGGWGTNLAGFLGTNQFGNGTNDWGAWGTNLEAIARNTGRTATNTEGQLEISSGWTNAAYQSLTNMIGQIQTNIFWEGLSNSVYPMYSDWNYFTNLLPVGSIGLGLAGLEPGAPPGEESEFGVLEPKIGGYSIFKADFKKSLRMDVFEDYVAGFWQWVVIAVEWSLLITVMFWYSEDLRAVIRDCLTVPEAPFASQQTLITLGTAAGGPAGYLAAKGAIFWLKMGTVLIICTVLMFAGSIMIVAADTLMAGHDIVAMTSDAVAGPGNALHNFLALVPFPIFQVSVILFNYFAAKWTVNGMVALLMIFFKVRPI